MAIGLFQTQMDTVLLLQYLLQIQNFLSFPTSLNPVEKLDYQQRLLTDSYSLFVFVVSGNETAIPGPHYKNVVTSLANRATSKAQVPSNVFHQSSIPSPPSTAPPSYRNNETTSPSRSLTSDRNGSPSPRSTPPPSYQEVMEGAYSEQPPTYWQTVLHPRQHNSDSE